MASKINSNLYREAPSSSFITPKPNVPCNEVNKNQKQEKKKTEKAQVISLNPKEEEKERKATHNNHNLKTLHFRSNRGYFILNHRNPCLEVLQTILI
jgi:hypothetical protein